MSKALVIDTSMLCCLLQVPGKETCGSHEDQWDYARVHSYIEKEKAQHTDKSKSK